MRPLLAIVLAVLLARPILARAAEPVDLALVLVSDVSRSVDDTEFQLQKQGYAAAFADPRVQSAIHNGAVGAIAVAYLEFSGPSEVRTVLEWRVIRDPATATAFTDALLAAGVTVNGLAIINDHPVSYTFAHVQPPGGLTEWYRRNVTGGPGSFVLEVHDFATFGEAMTRKLINEIAALPTLPGHG